MPKIIDFNAYRRPEIVLVMKDEASTVLHVTAPSEQLVGELRANLHELQTTLTKQDEEASRMVYHLAAKLCNCNLDGRTFTGEDLATKYGLNLEDMALFYMSYVEFIDEIEKAKN